MTFLFNRQKYALYKVITSKSIQVRYIQAQKRCKNPVREEFDCINATETSVIVAKTTENTTESAHIILDNSKVNNESESAHAEETEITEKGFSEMCFARQKELLEDSPEVKRATMRPAASYKPAGNMVINEDMRQAMVKQKAMEICLKRFFDGVIEKRETL